ncbi:MAG: chemotaxis protein CheR [Deltaproteobacteria bacterium]|nr:MAG: chemotaxis protein CheR [Deltaproteobacteria bacterium]
MKTYYVGIGASAGGLEALEDFFKNTPEDTNNVYVVIQHLSPDYKSMMNELLARHTNMPIHVAEDGMETEPNHVYLIPPSMNLSIYHSKLYLQAHLGHNHLNMPIDVFLKSLAQDQGKNAVGIILSGTGSDGTKGIKNIKEAGGMVMAQSLDSCKFDGMPKSAIATNMVDYVLIPEKMPEEIMNYISSPSIHKELAQKLQANEAIDDLTKITLVLRTHSGIDFSSYKENTIIRRIDRRIKINRCFDLKSYLELLRDSDQEKDILYNEMLIGVTSFFRDMEAYDLLAEKVFPTFDFSKGVIRIWSAGCSTGEEVYSVAIKLLEYMERNDIICDIKIFATDIDQRSLEFAGVGYYPDSLMSDVKSEYIAKYFNKKSDGYQINDTIRKMVVFAKHNVLKDPPFSKLDLLVCRNLFIYIKAYEQQNILNGFYYSLYPNGCLWLGSSESLGDMQKGFDVIDNKWKFFKYNSEFSPRIVRTESTKLDLHSTLERSDEEYDAVRRSTRFENILSSVLVKFLSPSIIINDEEKIVHVLGDVGKFMKIQTGRFSNKFSNNMSRELALFVNNCIRRLRSGQKEVILKNAINIGEISVDVQGIEIEVGHNDFFIISFIEQEETKNKKEIVEINMTEEVKSRVRLLENELQLAREGLQATIEELETSNEELQSSNEELIASNEELQSTNEELQSVNEELFTVNSEHQIKIEELTKATNDLSNLLKNTEVGALYLDSKLCIRKITPIMSKVTNILESDVGRPIAHLTVMKSYPQIISDIETVMDKLQVIEREIVDQEDNFWLVRIRPYRTEHNHIEGIILTIIDINTLKQAMQTNAEMAKRLHSAFSSSNIAWWEYNVDKNILNYSESNGEVLGYTKDESPNTIPELLKLIHPKDYNRVEERINEFFEGKIEELNIFYRIKHKDGSYRNHHNRATITKYKDNSPKRIIGTIVDVTEIKEYMRYYNE